MKKIVLVLMVFVSTLSASASCEYFQPGTIDELIDSIIQPEARGCCSWHGGVAGCYNHRVVCADGQFSPSCGC